MEQATADKSTLTQLGQKVSIPASPKDAKLETFTNPGINEVVFQTSEFTSLCPITGQPDWGQITVRYVPKDKCIESKSLKLYLQSYRQERGFAEELACRIATDLNNTCEPYFLMVQVMFSPRGGVGLTAVKTVDNTHKPLMVQAPGGKIVAIRR